MPHPVRSKHRGRSQSLLARKAAGEGKYNRYTTLPEEEF